MGQIESFKKVLGITDQPVRTPDNEDEVKEENIEVAPKRSTSTNKNLKKDKVKKRGPADTTLAVDASTREQVRDLAFWARKQGLIQENTSLEVIHLLMDCFFEKYPKAKTFVESY